MNEVSRSGDSGNTRRRALCQLAAFMAGSPLLEWAAFAGEASAAQQAGAAGQQGPAAPARPGVIRPPAYRDEIMKVVNLHEFEDLARKKVSVQAYNYIAAGAADELTLKANRSAFGDYWVRRKVMVDVSRIDTTVELFGRKLEHPIMLGPVGLRTLMNPDGERLTARAAAHTKSVLCGVQAGVLQELAKTNEAPMWWAATLGHSTQEETATWARRNEELGASALCVTVDYPYTGARDRPSRDQWESEFARTRVYSTDKGSIQFQPGMLDPYTPDLTWTWIKWARSASKLPVVVKGVLTAEDAKLCVQHGAQAVVVSNHGARTLDGTAGTLHVLAEVADAVGGKIPVLMDGGIRRGGDIVKAAALGAKAIMIGRPYLWGLGAFGQEGVQRVIELLHGELRTALALSGAGSLSALNRTFIRPAWKAYKPVLS
jgi:isopentenyl diphosphate isomerase/L-lactate dehydrogenase-like FMN-dependent dehydrogenase